MELGEEPMVGFEPTTPALRKRCSAVELHRRPLAWNTYPSGHSGSCKSNQAGSFLPVAGLQRAWLLRQKKWQAAVELHTVRALIR
jgi:hypothetical protein